MRVGDQGDGIAELDGARVFVPGTLPGERLRVRLLERRGDGQTAEPVAWLHQVERTTPPCPHFGPCGGCRLQHLPPSDYLDFKRQVVVNTLKRRGIECEVAPVVGTPPASRRRLRLAFRCNGRRVRLGFRTRRGHAVVDVHACPIARPELVGLFDPLRTLLVDLDPVLSGEIALTACANGVDLLVIADDAPDLNARERLATFATDQDLARVCWSSGATPEPIAVRRAPTVEVAAVPIAIPPRAFLQASLEAEAAMRAEVEGTIKASRVAELFAGIGTFGLPLARAGADVVAVERDPEAVAALTAGARGHELANRIQGEARDLERRPLTSSELAGFDAVILDPPRAGARAQAAALAASQVQRIAYVSCHPGSFARDARTLVDGGYQLVRVTPIDAFLWSAEVELVAAFVRPG